MRPVSLAVLAILLAGCESVPDLVFADDDGGGTDATAPADARSDGAGDATSADAPKVGCPDSPPPGTDSCCTGTAVPCKGVCNQAACTKCGACAAGEVCCARNGNGATCKALSICN